MNFIDRFNTFTAERESFKEKEQGFAYAIFTGANITLDQALHLSNGEVAELVYFDECSLVDVMVEFAKEYSLPTLYEKSHLTEVFKTVVEDMGFELVSVEIKSRSKNYSNHLKIFEMKIKKAKTES